MPRPRLAAVVVVAAVTCVACARGALAGFVDAKTDALRKAVQALPAAKVAAALDAASEALDIKALLTNGTAHATVTGDKPGALLPRPLAKLLSHAADGAAWKAEELHDLAEVFADSVETEPPPPPPVSPATPAIAEYVGDTSTDVVGEAADKHAGPAAPPPRPPLPLNPPGTKIVWDDGTWKVVPLTGAEKKAARAGARAKAAGPEAGDGAEEGEEDEIGPRVPRRPGGGPLAPDALSPDQSARVKELVVKKGLSEEAALTAVAATPGASVKVAYVWYLLNSAAADSPLDDNPLVVPATPAEVVVQQTPTEDASADAFSTPSRGRRLLQTTSPTVWAGNNANSVSSKSTPPDGALAVGAGYIVQASNSFYTVRSATTGALLQSATSFSTMLGVSTSIQLGDPRLVFDAAANRFFFACYGLLGTASWTYIATSKSSNPRSGWYVYRVSNAVTSWSGCGSSTPCFGDYPTLGQDRNSIWVTTNQFAQRSDGSMIYVGVGVWAIGKNALRSGATTGVPTYKWFISGNTGVFTLQPAKNSETGKMHLMAAYSTQYLYYVYATQTQRLNASPASAPTLSSAKYIQSTLQMPMPPDPIRQGNGDVLGGSDGRMQMCTQAGALPAANALLYCTLDIGCQMSGVSTTCMYVAAFTPTSTTVTFKSRVAIGAAGRHTLNGALAANPTSKIAGVVGIGVYRSSSSTYKVASLFYRYNSTSGRVTSSYIAANSGWLYDFVNPGRIGDYNDANVDAANVFYGQAEYGYPTTSWSATNWATNIFKAGIA